MSQTPLSGPQVSDKSPILEIHYSMKGMRCTLWYKYFVDIPVLVNVINNQSCVHDIIVKLFSNKLLYIRLGLFVVTAKWNKKFKKYISKYVCNTCCMKMYRDVCVTESVAKYTLKLAVSYYSGLLENNFLIISCTKL